MQTGLKEEAQ